MTSGHRHTWSTALVVLGGFLVVLGLFIGLQTPDAVTFADPSSRPPACGAPFHRGADGSKAVCAPSLDRREHRAWVALLAGVGVAGVGVALWVLERRRGDPGADASSSPGGPPPTVATEWSA